MSQAARRVRPNILVPPRWSPDGARSLEESLTTLPCTGAWRRASPAALPFPWRKRTRCLSPASPSAHRSPGQRHRPRRSLSRTRSPYLVL